MAPAAGALPVEQAVDYVLQGLEAIAQAHALGIVHRDLKPANLFTVVRADGQLSVKVLDFGISKVTTPGAQGNDMTRTAAIVGSPLYMSPEQLQASKGVDVRSDLWSLGVILFELLTTRAPFGAEAVTELVIQIATQPAPAVRSLRADTPPGLEQVIARCLEKDRERRFANVGELAVALAPFGSRRAAASVERVLGTLQKGGLPGGARAAADPRSSGAFQASPTPVGPQTSAAWDHEGTAARSRAGAGAWIAAGLAATLALTAGGFALVKTHGRAAARDVPAAAAASSGPAAVPTPVASNSPAAPSAAEGAALPPLPPEPPPSATPEEGVPGGGPASPAARRSEGRASCRRARGPAGVRPAFHLRRSGAKHFKPECVLKK